MSLSRYLGYRLTGTAIVLHARTRAYKKEAVLAYKRMAQAVEDGRATKDELVARLVEDTYGLDDEVLYRLALMKKAGVIDFLPTSRRLDLTKPLEQEQEKTILQALVGKWTIISVIAAFALVMSKTIAVNVLPDSSPHLQMILLSVLLVLEWPIIQKLGMWASIYEDEQLHVLSEQGNVTAQNRLRQKRASVGWSKKASIVFYGVIGVCLSAFLVQHFSVDPSIDGWIWLTSAAMICYLATQAYRNV